MSSLRVTQHERERAGKCETRYVSKLLISNLKCFQTHILCAETSNSPSVDVTSNEIKKGTSGANVSYVNQNVFLFIKVHLSSCSMFPFTGSN